MKLTAQEKYILSKLTVKTLAYLSKIAQDQEFETVKKVIDYFTNVERDRFLGEKEYDPQALATEHAFARGKIGGAAQILRIFMGAKHELLRREEERKKVRE